MDEMDEIVTCPQCSRPEYFGDIHWNNGRQYCRVCIYNLWRELSKYTWSPGPDEKVFPEKGGK